MARTLFDKLAPHLLRPLNDKQYMILDYLWHGHRLPRLNPPQTLTEKLTWLKIHYRDPLLQQCSDKYLVRDYVRRVVDRDVLIPLIGVYDAPEEIARESLPESFVLKATHGSGWNVICRSRAAFDFDAAARLLSAHLRRSYFDLGREWCYKDLQPRIVCEELLQTADGKIPEDYKFYCFHGEPKLLKGDYDRFGSPSLNFYDLDWRLMPCRSPLYPNNLEAGSRPPAALPAMLEVARLLSKPFPFVRVDLYTLDQQVYFGELTFYPGRGVLRYEPPEFDDIFGSYLDLKTVAGQVE